jgi:hypothetical protein
MAWIDHALIHVKKSESENSKKKISAREREVPLKPELSIK